MTEVNFDNYKQILSEFVEKYIEYTDWLAIFAPFSSEAEIRTWLQRKTILLTSIIEQVHGVTVYTMGDRSKSFHETLGFTLMKDSNTSRFWEDAKEYVIRIINEAIGSIDNNTLPVKEIEPVIPIKDETLQARCFDLLQAPGNFDRVINQATQVFEAKLRDSIPHEKLCELIPEAKNHIGEQLVNNLLSPKEPVIVITDDLKGRIAFHKMAVGIMAYLRNPSHHFLDDKIEWALAWSVVGIIDSLLSVLKNSYIPEDTKDNKPQRKQK